MGMKHKRLIPLRYGFQSEDKFFSPTDFAQAFIGIRKPKEISNIIDEEVEKVYYKETKPRDTPALAKHILEADRKSKKVDIDYFRDIAREVFGTSKIIDLEAVIPKGKGHLATYSENGMISMTVRSRKDERKKSRKHEVTLNKPFMETLDDITNFSFSGGTLQLDKNINKGNILSIGQPHHKAFYKHILDKARKLYEKKGIRLTPENNPVKKLIQEPRLAEYSVACSLTLLGDVLRKGNLHMVKGLKAGEEFQASMPYSFLEHPRYALETLLMRHDLPRETKEHEDSPIAIIDRYLIDKDIETRQFVDMLGEGLATRGVMIKNRDYSNYMWSFAFALIDHHIEKYRVPAGFSIKFKDTNFETIGTNFVGYADQVLNQRNKNLCASIIFSKSDKAYNMYENYSVPEGSYVEGLQERNPSEFVNPPKDVRDKRYNNKEYTDIDYRTGMKASISLSSPTKKILKSAEKISKEYGEILAGKPVKGISAEAYRKEYLGEIERIRISVKRKYGISE